MIKTIVTRALQVVFKKPIRLWAISLLSGFLTSVFSFLCGITIPGLGIAVSLLMSVGMTMVFLHGYRGEQVRAVQLFDAFKDWATIKRTLCGMGWATLWTFLWGLIPIVGIVFAIIRAYEYRLVPYILVNEPDVKPTDAIKVSKERTDGYKLSMFLTDLLPVAAGVIVVLVLGLLGLIPKIGGFFIFLLVVALILLALIVPLFNGLVKSAYYEEITNPTMDVAGLEVKTCPFCGAVVDPYVIFCPKCGRKIGGEEVLAEAAEETVKEAAEAAEEAVSDAADAVSDEITGKDK